MWKKNVIKIISSINALKHLKNFKNVRLFARNKTSMPTLVILISSDGHEYRYVYKISTYRSWKTWVENNYLFCHSPGTHTAWKIKKNKFSMAMQQVEFSFYLQRISQLMTSQKNTVLMRRRCCWWFHEWELNFSVVSAYDSFIHWIVFSLFWQQQEKKMFATCLDVAAALSH